jgi:hypothetical protein
MGIWLGPYKKCVKIASFTALAATWLDKCIYLTDAYTDTSKKMMQQ